MFPENETNTKSKNIIDNLRDVLFQSNIRGFKYVSNTSNTLRKLS